MKKQLLNNSTRNIKRSFPRFLSLLIMSLLGVFAFSGLQATAPDMINSLDKYLDDHLTYDIKITSSLGLSDEDIIELKKIDGVEEIYGSYNKDVLVEIDNEDFVIALSSISTNMNTLKLIDGNLPTNKEIVVEENMLKKSPLKIGDALTIEGETYTISGTVDSSLYFNYCGVSQSRGTSSIGSGVINYYAFLDASNFDVSYYSYIYITVSNALKQTTSSKKYNKLVDNVLDKINDCKSTLENNRYAYIYNETQSKIDEANKKLNDAKKILDKTKEDLDTALNTINTNVAALDSALLKKGFTRASIDPALETLPATRDSYPVGS